MKRILFLLLSAWLAAVAWGQSYTISGTVTDKQSGETLIGATVMDLLTGKGTVTNAYGRYSLTLRSDSVSLRVSFVGYQNYQETFLLTSNRSLSPALKPSVSLDEVVITADKAQNLRSSQMSAVDIPIEHIKAVPVLFGESDILKAVQLLPGVQAGNEGSSGFYVRGGGPDENLFLLDGVPLYNVNHLGGFFSAFNSDAIKNVTLYKGSFPAHFGGRLSSVLDVTTNNGNAHELHGVASIGLISAKVGVEGPLVTDKTTFNLSFRRTYLDVVGQPIIRLISKNEGVSASGGYYFYDLNAKVTHRFSDKSQLFATYYMGDDVVNLRVLTSASMEQNGSLYDQYVRLGYHWGNVVGALRWNYIVNPRLFLNVTAAYTRYRNIVNLGYENVNLDTQAGQDDIGMSYRSGIHDVSLRADFDYQPTPEHGIKFGLTTCHHIFNPEVVDLNMHTEDGSSAFNIDTAMGSSSVRANEMTFYAEDDWSLSDAVKINFGVNVSGFAVQDTFYPSVQPRVSGRLLLSDDLSFKVGYSYMTQYMHLLSNSSISLPTDLWVPATKRIAPMYAHQVAAGFFYNFRSLVDFSVEGYYKKMRNLMEYRDGASFVGSSLGWEDNVVLGDGWAYGVEFLAQKNVGKLTGWIGYTWSRTMRQFDREGQTLNNGEPFPAKYDRRHDFSFVVMYKPNDRFDVSATWVYSTGNAVTMAMQSFGNGNDDYNHGRVTTNTDHGVSGDISSRNNFRMPNYHRMDLGVNFHRQLKHGKRTINISVYNVYNRLNPFLIYRSNRYQYTYGSTTYKSALVQLSLFPVIPSVSYTYKF
ncbi:MAG: TonB-dependent receptor [Bacteroidales bacterium]|nr:TonB-dependent receptor [Bacteroidales bacterium]